MWRILWYAEPEVCVCVSVGSTWFSDMPAKWAEERSWCSNIHKINFSCGCEVNFWRNIWNGSPLICVTDLAHPYNLNDPEKILSHTHTRTSACFSYATSSHTLIFPIKDYWTLRCLLLLTNFESHIFYNELNIVKYMKQYLFTHLCHFQLSS